MMDLRKAIEVLSNKETKATTEVYDGKKFIHYHLAGHSQYMTYMCESLLIIGELLTDNRSPEEPSVCFIVGKIFPIVNINGNIYVLISNNTSTEDFVRIGDTSHTNRRNIFKKYFNLFVDGVEIKRSENNIADMIICTRNRSGLSIPLQVSYNNDEVVVTSSFIYDLRVIEVLDSNFNFNNCKIGRLESIGFFELVDNSYNRNIILYPASEDPIVLDDGINKIFEEGK